MAGRVANPPHFGYQCNCGARVTTAVEFHQVINMTRLIRGALCGLALLAPFACSSSGGGGGCKSDSECASGRICESGECVNQTASNGGSSSSSGGNTSLGGIISKGGSSSSSGGGPGSGGSSSSGGSPGGPPSIGGSQNSDADSGVPGPPAPGPDVEPICGSVQLANSSAPDKANAAFCFGMAYPDDYLCNFDAETNATFCQGASTAYVILWDDSSDTTVGNIYDASDESFLAQVVQGPTGSFLIGWDDGAVGECTVEGDLATLCVWVDQ